MHWLIDYLYCGSVSPAGEECSGWPGTLSLMILEMTAKLPLPRDTFYSINYKNNIAGACSWMSPENPIFSLRRWMIGTQRDTRGAHERKTV